MRGFERFEPSAGPTGSTCWTWRIPSRAPRVAAALTHDLLLVTLGEELHGGGSPPGSLQEPLTLRVLPELPQDRGVSGGQGRQTLFGVFHAPGALLLPALHHRRARMLRAGLPARRLGSSGDRPLHGPFEVPVHDRTVVSVAFLVVRSVLGPFRGIHCFFFFPCSWFFTLLNSCWTSLSYRPQVSLTVTSNPPLGAASSGFIAADNPGRAPIGWQDQWACPTSRVYTSYTFTVLV